MDTWMNARWPLSFLDATIMWKLADSLDPITATGLGYPKFAAALNYMPPEIELIRVRGAANAGNSNSATYALLLDYAAKRGSVQGIQHALEQIGHIAAEIIPPYIERMLQLQTGYPLSYNVDQNSDVFNCNCPQCRRQAPDYRSINPDRPQSSVSHQSDTGKRRQTQTARPTSIGCAVPGSNLNNPPNNASPAWNNGYSSAQNSKMTYVNNPSANQTPSTRTPNPCVEKNITCQHSSPAINSNINDTPCWPNCEACRIRSDPEQTQRLTLRSNPKAPCMLDTRSYLNTEYGVHEPEYEINSVGNDRLGNSFSQLYLDSEESQETSSSNHETSSSNHETSDETYVNSVFSESDKVHSNVSSSEGGESLAEGNNQTGSILPNRNSLRRPLCSKSDVGEHRLGDMIDDCPVCRNNPGARPKTGSKSSTRPRNASAPEGIELERNSWPYTSRKMKNETGNMHSVMSDSILCVPQFSSSNSQHSDGDHVIEETLYEIISSYRPVHSAESNRNVPSVGASSDRPSVGASSDRPSVGASSDRPSVGASSDRPSVGASGDNPPFSIALRNAQRGREFVFLTYSWNEITDPESFTQEIRDLYLALREAGIQVKIDMDENSYTRLRLNRLDWIDKNVREAKYVIVCVSPTYSTDIQEPDPKQLASPRPSQLNARYIFDKLREEYYSNQCQNRRVIPVMFTNYGTTMQPHVPSCMRSTFVYSYPDRIDAIIAAARGCGSYKPS